MASVMAPTEIAASAPAPASTPAPSITSSPTSKSHSKSKSQQDASDLRYLQFPPSPPRSDNSSASSTSSADSDVDEPTTAFTVPLPPPSITPTLTVLPLDAKTPDAHVPRDPRLVRLTGVHPFNVEAPLTALFDSGFLTPPELFYVRNHGAVPNVSATDVADWEISIEGMVHNPVTLSLSEIVRGMEQVTRPVTLVCAGNRRKEQNMIRKSQGFSWGAAGVSTALFTGPMLAELLERARPRRGARFVCMEGIDELPNGHYGTSVKLSTAMDRERGLMVAHLMNGEQLTPDHGYPVRVVVPGQIGGRSVKWLKRIIVTAEPSTNWYHKFDNRVLPTMVTPEMAKADESWWRDERYAIYDLSVNSAVAYPRHGETLALPAAGAEGGEEEVYTARGYAYSGGLRKISRVELSLDGGRSWRLASIQYPEDLYSTFTLPEDATLYGGQLGHDATYCWCFWSLDIPVKDLAGAQDMVLRAMDDSLCVQPRDPYWSVLGMMHNSWFRVAIRKEDGGLRFEHPTLPALQAGGWMERVKEAGGDVLDGHYGEPPAGSTAATAPTTTAKPEAVKMTNDTVSRVIEFAELQQHAGAEEPWFVVAGEVYDGTPFLAGHPGGAQSIVSAAATDATDEFLAIHSDSAKAMLVDYHIGTLSPAARAALAAGEVAAEAAAEAEAGEGDFLNPRAWKSSTLLAKREISQDTTVFTFATSPHTTLGLPVGQHLLLSLPGSPSAIIKPYTPLSPDASPTLELLVKLYPDGVMSQALAALPIGGAVKVKGPVGKLHYRGRGVVTLNGGPERRVRKFVMVAAGSGITPVLSVLRAVVGDAEDATRCVLLFGNREEGDVLCREELEQWEAAERAREGGSRMELVLTLTKPSEGWQRPGRRTGRIGRPMLEEFVGRKGEGEADTMVLVCGPEPMERGVRADLTEMGWAEGDMVFF
ncbi:nitrate reductase [Geopyxis carbonaria]|nr:nitrate reductase [Geopyxis carbonaria]